MSRDVQVTIPGVGVFTVPEDKKEDLLSLREALAANDPQTKVLTQLLATFIEHQKSLMFRYTQDMKQMVDAVKAIQVQVPEVKIPEIKIPEIKAPEVKIPPMEMPKIEVPKADAAQVKIDAPIVHVPVAEEVDVTDIQRDERTNRITGCKFKTVSWKDGGARH